MTITDVFLDHKRANVCEHMVKMAPHDTFLLPFSQCFLVHSLLTDEDFYEAEISRLIFQVTSSLFISKGHLFFIFGNLSQCCFL